MTSKKRLLLPFIFLFIAALAQAKPLVVMLDWFVNPDHAPLFVAQQQGYFKQAGLQVKFIPPADPSDATKLVADDKADLGVSYEPEFLVAVAKGLPLVRVGVLVDHPLACVMALKNGPIHSLNNLKGKPVGYIAGIVSDVILKTMLNQHGLKLNQLKLITFHYGQVQALLAHRIDAMTGAMRNFEPFEVEAAGKKVRLFYPEKNGVPPYDELIFVTNKKEANDPRLPLFFKALQKGVTYLEKHPKQSWKVFAKNHPALDNALNKKAWFASLAYFAKNPAEFNREQYQNFVAFLKKNQLVKHMPPMVSYIKKIRNFQKKH